MASDEAFLTDILEHPDDDVPRLVYADWLEETRGASAAHRADFIRVQCRLARLPEDDPGRLALQAQERRLLHSHADSWLQEIPAWARKAAVFRRGFVEEVSSRTAGFLRRAASLFNKSPVQTVHLKDVTSARLTSLSALPQLDRLTTLGLALTSPAPTGLTALLHAPGVHRLRELILQLENGNSEGLDAFPSTLQLRSLVALGIQGAVGPRGVERLAPGNRSRPLELFEVRQGALQNRGAAVLAGSALLGQIQTLRLVDCGIGPEGVDTLIDRANGPGPVTLDLSYNPIGARGVQALASSPWLARLRVLILDEVCPPGAGVAIDRTAEALATSPYLGNLEELSLNRARVAYPALNLTPFVSSPAFRKLRILRAWNCNLGERDVHGLAELPALRTLVMGDSGLSAQRLRELREEFKGRLKIV